MAEQINQPDRERIIAERRAEISELMKQRSQLFRAAIVFMRYPGKTKKVIAARRNKAFAYGLQAMMLSYRITAVASQPIPKFNTGANELAAVIGESGPEMIEVKDGVFYSQPRRKTNIFPTLPKRGKTGIDHMHISELIKQFLIPRF